MTAKDRFDLCKLFLVAQNLKKKKNVSYYSTQYLRILEIPQMSILIMGEYLTILGVNFYLPQVQEKLYQDTCVKSTLMPSGELTAK